MKRATRAQVAGFLLAAGSLATGCGGISGSHSVSPATFLLPGLLKAEPPRPLPGAQTNWVAVAGVPAPSFRN
jgi:hypothetical protein